MSETQNCPICSIPAFLKDYTFYGRSGPYKLSYWLCYKCGRQWQEGAPQKPETPGKQMPEGRNYVEVATTAVSATFDEMGCIRDWCDSQRNEWTRAFLTGKVGFKAYQSEMERCLSVANERAAKVYKEQKNTRSKTA